MQTGNRSKNIAIFGSTGSIGVQTLDVISRNPAEFRAYALIAKSSEQKLREQTEVFHPEISLLIDRDGTEPMLRAAKDPNVDIVVAAMVGFAGLRPTIEAIKAGKRVCIANKETFVVAGELMNALALQSGAEILPIDSEHSAIAQCLVGEEKDSIKKIILTASGGPFRSRAKETFESITSAEALRHPNWSMGPKITIDSATLMNKGLEIIEAHWLFQVPLERIEVIIHPQSVIHSMVEFRDGSVKAQLGAPDMHLPIQYALGYPKRLGVEYDALDLLRNNRLDFETPDTEKFPCLRIAREASERGGLYPCILNAANEVAVEAFLEGEIRFIDIPAIIEEVITDAPAHSSEALDASGEAAIEKSLTRIFECDEKTRFHTKQAVEKVSIA